MDEQDFEGLDWIYIRRQEMRTAKGEFDFDIYAGKVRIDEQKFDIPVHVGDGSTGNFNRPPVAEKSAVSS
jgi:predicted aspartyl protease